MEKEMRMVSPIQFQGWRSCMLPKGKMTLGVEFGELYLGSVGRPQRDF